MPLSPSILKSIEAIRKAISSPTKKGGQHFELYSAVRTLFQQSEKIAVDLESIKAVLSLAPDIESFRGKGSQGSANEFARAISYLTYPVKERLPLSEKVPDSFPKEADIPFSAKDVVDCVECLADHAFSRTQGPPVRSRHAGELRAIAWRTLALVTEILRRPEHLAHALKVAGDTRASVKERTAAVEFLSEYWGSDDPDEPTISLLRKLEKNPPDRDFLVTVMQAQIDLGLNNEFGALDTVDDWDDAEEE